MTNDDIGPTDSLCITARVGHYIHFRSKTEYAIGRRGVLHTAGFFFFLARSHAVGARLVDAKFRPGPTIPRSLGSESR